MADESGAATVSLMSRGHEEPEVIRQSRELHPAFLPQDDMKSGRRIFFSTSCELHQ